MATKDLRAALHKEVPIYKVSDSNEEVKEQHEVVDQLFDQIDQLDKTHQDWITKYVARKLNLGLESDGFVQGTDSNVFQVLEVLADFCQWLKRPA